VFDKFQADGMIAAARKFDAVQDKLREFFLPIVEALGFTELKPVDINHADGEGYFNVGVAWYGPYQSEDHQTFSVPTDVLVAGADATLAYMKETMVERANEAASNVLKEQAKMERELRDRLVAKWGPPS
jgi:hypothetical protein